MRNKSLSIGINKDEYLLLVALALFGVDFMLQGIAILVIYGLFFVLKQRVLNVRNFFCIFTFSLFFLLFYITSSREGIFDLAVIKTLIALPLAFLIGYNIIKDCTSEKIAFYLVFVAFFMALHPIINLFYNISLFGMAALTMRESYDVWGHAVAASTAQATNFTPFIACIIYLVFFNKKKTLRFISIVFLFLVIVYDLELGGRSALVLFLFSIVISFFLGMIRSKNRRNTTVYLIVFLFVIVLLVLAYTANLFGVQELFENTSLNQRFDKSIGGQDIEEDDRMRRKLIYLAHLFDYPVGGQHLCYDLGVGHAHDLWLDAFDMAGLIPLFFLLCYTFYSVRRAIRCFMTPSFDPYIAVVILVFVIIMNIQFFLEPIIEGSPKLLILYCMVDGMISSYLNTTKKWQSIQTLHTS